MIVFISFIAGAAIGSVLAIWLPNENPYRPTYIDEDLEGFRFLWEEYAMAEDADLTPGAKILKDQLLDIVGQSSKKN